MILIGSRSLKLRAPNLLSRPPVDFDWLCTKVEFDEWLEKNSYKVKPTKVYELPEFNKWIIEGSTPCEFEIITPGHSSELLADIVYNDKESIDTSFGMVPTLNVLFAIKDSHKYKKFNNSANGFWKTAIDWHTMTRCGARILTEHETFNKLRSKESYNYSHPKLNQSKEGFFSDDSISYKYDHDTIHQSVARGDNPAYTLYMKDGAAVQCDKSKFFALPEEVRLNGVIEEAAVLAIERSLVPHPGIWTPEYAWRFALSKVCSSITSGWFRAFAYENLFQILKLYPTGYWEKFQEDVKSGLVKPFTVSEY